MSDDTFALLRRWRDAGAHWAVVSRHADSITIGLYRCDGGEEVDRITSTDPWLREFLAAHASSMD